MKINHIGYAVKNMDKALYSFKQLGFNFEPIVNDVERNIKITFGDKDGYRIELVCPLNKEQASPVDTYLSSIGPTTYHICYQTENLDTEIERLKEEGFKVILEPKEAVAFGNKKVVFLMNLSLGLMEIVEEC